jgi:hypothetical protein
MEHLNSFLLSSRSIAATVLVLAALHGRAQCSSTDGLTTLYAQDNGLDGVMFDIVTSGSITVECFDINWASGTTGISLFYKVGTHVGFEESPGDWTLVDTVMGLVTAGTDQPTPLPIDVDLLVPAGSTYAFYICNSSSSDPNAEYSDGTVLGAVLASDAYLQILEGTGVVDQFGTSHFAPRKFNGTLYYSVGGVGVDEHEESGVALYPNPATDRVTLDLSSHGGAQRITLLDVSGRVVMDRNANGGSRIDLDLAHLPVGTYTVRSVSNTGTLAQQLVVR